MPPACGLVLVPSRATRRVTRTYGGTPPAASPEPGCRSSRTGMRARTDSSPRARPLQERPAYEETARARGNGGCSEHGSAPRPGTRPPRRRTGRARTEHPGARPGRTAGAHAAHGHRLRRRALGLRPPHPPHPSHSRPCRWIPRSGVRRAGCRDRLLRRRERRAGARDARGRTRERCVRLPLRGLQAVRRARGRRSREPAPAARFGTLPRRPADRVSRHRPRDASAPGPPPRTRAGPHRGAAGGAAASRAPPWPAAGRGRGRARGASASGSAAGSR
ncbi:hypothetical protein HGI09_53880 [Streptomyces collinus]|nr:hypothetical protein HGI10_10230 [Streptomyces collinus]UJA18007.1 hypothetical protein HGI09_53880 [Streptomyces collinus]